MSRPASEWADGVASRARGMNLHVRRMERLFSQRAIPRVDIERVYAGSLLSYHAFLEQAIERFFVGLMMGRFVCGDPAIRSLVSIKSDQVAYAILRGERSYVDWLPYKRYTLRRAKAFLSRGRPFTNLTGAQIKAFDRLTTLRNALAHESFSARRAFRKTFTDGKALPPDQLRPAGYLRGQHAAGQTRFDFLLSDVVGVVRVLTV